MKRPEQLHNIAIMFIILYDSKKINDIERSPIRVMTEIVNFKIKCAFIVVSY